MRVARSAIIAGLAATTLSACSGGGGRTALPPTDMAAFTPAGGVRTTAADLLTYAEALLSPASGPSGALMPPSEAA